jgi:hypothetical protein
MGSNAASKAAQQEQQGYTNASTYEKGQNALAVTQQQGTTAGITGALTPYNTTGQQSTNQLAGLLAPGGSLTQGYGSFSAPTAAQAQATPGYQFQLQQGMNALQNSAAARGGLLSTGNEKNIENYAQGVASENYGNTYNQALQAYQSNASTFYNNQNNLYNRLSGTAGQGIQAAGTMGGLQQQGANALNALYFNGGQEIGQNDIGSANAAAQGTLGANNAMVGGINGAVNSVGQTIAGLSGAANAGAGSNMGGGGWGYNAPTSYSQLPGTGVNGSGFDSNGNPLAY